MAKKWVYLFSEGNANMRELLGGKGANLAEMTSMGLPVPQGFTITTEACTQYYEDGRKINDEIQGQINEYIVKMEEITGKKFGDKENPLLVSVRSGARASMPGMMDTILNLGLNETVVNTIAEMSGNPRWAWDCYRRFIQMYSDVVMEVGKKYFEELIDQMKAKKGVTQDVDLDADDLKELASQFKAEYKAKIGEDFPDGKPKKNGFGEYGPFVTNGPRVHEFIREMNEKVLSRYDIMTVGEAQGVNLEQAKQYANADGTELDMIFQFEHVSAWKTTAGAFIGKWGVNKPQMPKVRALLNKWQLGLEGASWNSLFWNNHDQPRAVSRFGNDRPEWREISAKMLAACLHLMKGTPYILQGEELGMTNMHFTSLDQCRDVEELGIYRQAVEEQHICTHEQMLAAFDNVARDNCRTPPREGD